MSEENDDRKEKIKLDLADMLMKTIPSLPDNIHDMTAEEQENLFKTIDSRAERILELVGDSKRRATGPRRATGVRRSERFNTPELDRKIVRKSRRTDEDEE